MGMTKLNEREILVIDDSPAIGLFFRDFLQKLGFSKIHTCENGETGIKTFEEIVSTGKVPIVFLDYNLPDMNGFSVLTQLLIKRPDVKVIIETSREKNEETIKKVIAEGAYEYLSKPIRLENVKEIIDTISKEEEYGETGSPEDITDKVEFLIKFSTQFSLTRISQYMEKPKEEINLIIKKLVSEHKIKSLDNIKEIACPECGSVKISQTFHCPSCKGSKFKQEKLIEHYDCGNTSSEKEYVEDVCPKCRKKNPSSRF